jgi:hypothetical protein
MAGSRGKGKASEPVTAASIAAEGRRVTKSDVRRKLREIGGYVGEDDTVAEAVIEAAVVAEAEQMEQARLGPLAGVVTQFPKAELIAVAAFVAVVVVFKNGELVGRPRGPQVELRPLRWDPTS